MNEYPNSLLKFVKIFLLLKAFPMYLFLNFGALHRLRRGQRHRHCLTFPPAAKERRHPCQAKRHLFRAIPSACGFVSARTRKRPKNRPADPGKIEQSVYYYLLYSILCKKKRGKQKFVHFPFFLPIFD